MIAWEKMQSGKRDVIRAWIEYTIVKSSLQRSWRLSESVADTSMWHYIKANWLTVLSKDLWAPDPAGAIWLAKVLLVDTAHSGCVKLFLDKTRHSMLNTTTQNCYHAKNRSRMKNENVSWKHYHDKYLIRSLSRPIVAGKIRGCKPGELPELEWLADALGLGVG
jgi:hypothetical protein